MTEGLSWNTSLTILAALHLWCRLFQLQLNVCLLLFSFGYECMILGQNIQSPNGCTGHHLDYLFVSQRFVCCAWHCTLANWCKGPVWMIWNLELLINELIHRFIKMKFISREVSGWCYLGSQGLQFLYIDERVVMCSSSDIFWHPKSIIPVECCIINSLRPSDAYMRR